MIGDKLEIYTFDYLMNLALGDVPDTMDKRQGSIIYDSLAPFCYRMADIFQKMRMIYRDTYATTATGEELDNRVAEQGITRYQATYAVKKAYITDTQGNPMSIPLGARFSSISDTAPVNYAVTSAYSEGGAVVPGYYELTCEAAGTSGNEYAGNLINITNIVNIGSAVMSTLLTPARDAESDDDLRSRYFETLYNKPYGGNFAQYREQVGSIPGVGAVQVYPVWRGGGTVKISILDTDFNLCTPEFMSQVQKQVDPENAQGDKGLGLGFAPIGHAVTIATPEEVTVNISINVVFSGSYTLSQLSSSIKEAVNTYSDELKKTWDEPDEYGQYSLSMYQARVTSAILTVGGVANATNLTLNGAAEDITFTQTGELQQIPKIGTITVNGTVI